MTRWLHVLFFICCVASRGTSFKRNARCEIMEEFPKLEKENCPSMVKACKVEVVMDGEERHLNISWTIGIDASISHLTGTRIHVGGEGPYVCKYNPPFTEASLAGLEQESFFFFLKVFGSREYPVRVMNLPIPPTDLRSIELVKYINVPKAPTPPAKITGSSLLCAHQSTQQPTTSTTTTDTEIPPTTGIKNTSIVAIGVVASLIILSSCIVIYKYCMTVSDFEIIPLTPMVPVSVVVVYPAETPAFQRAVAALAEFLQWHGGCRVAIDMWQQEKIAELGPLRWLADQVKNADRVLIVSPLAKTTSSLQGHSPPTKSLPEHSIPAAAHDLYPLVLNMVASHAKSASELAKFWVVKLHPKNNKKSCVLLPELCTCKIFCLIKDLNKLCKNLHAEKAGKKIWSILVKPEAFYNQNSTAKLREAIEMLGANKPQISNGINHPDLC